MKLNQFYVDNLIKEAISEDINYIDVSADYLIPENQRNDSCFPLHFISTILLSFSCLLPQFQL